MVSSPQHPDIVTQALLDGMVLRGLRVRTQDMGYLKSIVEAHPGLAALHVPAEPRRDGAVHAALLTTANQEQQLDALLSDLTVELVGLRPVAWGNDGAR